MKKIVVMVIAFSVFLIGFALLLNTEKNHSINKVISIKETHNYISYDDGKSINQYLYFSNENKYARKELIEEISFTDKNEQKKISLDVLDVQNTEYSYMVDNHKYTCYKYELLLPDLRVNISIDEAYLRIVSNGDILKVEIGSLSIRSNKMLSFGDHLSINMLEGRIVDYPFDTLGCIDIKIENKANSTVIIKDIYIDNDVYIDCDLIDSNINLDDYHIFSELDKDFNEIMMYSYQNLELQLPLKYNKIKRLKASYILIYYEINGQSYVHVQDTFNFFDNNYKIPELSEVIYVNEYR